MNRTQLKVRKVLSFTVIFLHMKMCRLLASEVNTKMRKKIYIFSLNQIIEKYLEQQLPCLVNFIDFKTAFDPQAITLGNP